MSRIFQGVKYHFPSCVPQDRQNALAKLLTQHNATRADSIHDATHIISNSDTFEGWRDVEGVAVVTELWVAGSIAANKLQSPSHYSADPSMLFSGVVGCCAELRPSDEEVITVGITTLGGQMRVGLTKDVTHLFAMDTHSQKYETAISHPNSSIKVLHPQWFDDTVSLGKPNLDTKAYEWPDPAVLNRRPQSPSKELQQRSMSPQKRAFYRTATHDLDSKRQLDSQDVWGGRHILISTTLELTGTRRRIVEDGIRKAKGVVVKYASNGGDGMEEEELRLIQHCDVFVTRHRTGRAFFQAWAGKKTIGTLSWLLNVQVTGVLSSPMDQLLHFPYPEDPVAGFETHRISVTNYAGEMRDYLKKLIGLMGGNFTPTFSSDNTALVAADTTGTKSEKAASWSIPVVNHTWLEDCFLRWKNLTPATKKYVTYPTGVTFSSILGDRRFGADIIEIIESEAAAFEEEHAEDDRAPHTPLMSPNSFEETEVEGGLMAMPSMDAVFSTPKSTLKSAAKSAGPGRTQDSDAEMDDAEPSPSSGRRLRTHAGPSTPKSAPRSPAKPQFFAGVDADVEMEDAAEDVPPRRLRPEPSTPKSTASKTRGKPAPADSDDDMAAADESPRRHSARGGPSTPKSPVSFAAVNPVSKKKYIKGLLTSSDSEIDPEIANKVVRVQRPPASPAQPMATLKGKEKSKTVEVESEVSQSDDERVVQRQQPVRKPLKRRVTMPTAAAHVSPPVSPLHRSSRKVAGADAEDDEPVARTRDLPRLLDSGSEELDFPAELLPLATQVPRATQGPKKLAQARKATPTPPSSPLSPAISPVAAKVTKQASMKKMEVVVPTAASLSLSTRKPMTERTHGVTATAHQRASTSRASPVSAPPRSHTSTTAASARASSPASSSMIIGRSKRSAAAKATQRLHDEIMPDVINFQNEMRGQARKTRRVSGRSEVETDNGDDEEDEPIPKKRKLDGGKKLRKSPSFDDRVDEQPPRKSDAGSRPTKTMKLVITQADVSDEVLKVLAKLGAKVTNKPTECTHLIVPSLVRTEKFLCALTAAPIILTKEWALESAAANELLPEADYLLKDDAGDKKYKFRLVDALARAKKLKGTLFKEHTFYITPKAHSNLDLVQNIVRAGGGQCVPVTQPPSLRTLQTQPNNRHLISSPDEEDLWRHIAISLPVYNTELILTSALRQQIDWEDVGFRVLGSV